MKHQYRVRSQGCELSAAHGSLNHGSGVQIDLNDNVFGNVHVPVVLHQRASRPMKYIFELDIVNKIHVKQFDVDVMCNAIRMTYMSRRVKVATVGGESLPFLPFSIVLVLTFGFSIRVK